MVEIAQIVRHHHERWDGRGYPDALAGPNVPLGGRIIAVADAFSAMITDRIYRPALPLERAWAELRAHSGSQFDPEIVEVFGQVVDEEGRLRRLEDSIEGRLSRDVQTVRMSSRELHDRLAMLPNMESIAAPPVAEEVCPVAGPGETCAVAESGEGCEPVAADGTADPASGARQVA